jgi:hypothetical protein
MRRLIAIGTVALLVLVVVPLTSAGTTPVTKHVDGSVVVWEPNNDSPDRTWMARFEVRTLSGKVQFGYLELYGIGGNVAGQIHEFSIDSVDYYRTPSGALGARLHMQECVINPSTPCFPSDYVVTDGSAVHQGDTFMDFLGWKVQSGNLSIYSTGGQG